MALRSKILALLVALTSLRLEADEAPKENLEESGRALINTRALMERAARDFTPPSIAEQMGVTQLPLPSNDDIFGAFGGSFDRQSKKFLFRMDVGSEKPRKYLLFNLMKLVEGAENKNLTSQLIAMSPCGRRAFEIIVAYDPKPRGDASRSRVGLMWDCENRCLAVLETVDTASTPKTISGVSPSVAIPHEFCAAIWGGTLSLEERLDASAIE